MSDQPAQPWTPTTFVRFERAFDTSTCTARIVTDAGPAYIKTMGNRQGPHALFNDFQIRAVPDASIDSFAAEVAQEAHA